MSKESKSSKKSEGKPLYASRESAAFESVSAPTNPEMPKGKPRPPTKE